MPGLVALVQGDGHVAAASTEWHKRLGTTTAAVQSEAGLLQDALRAGQETGRATVEMDGARHPVEWSSRALEEDGRAAWLVRLDVLPNPGGERRFKSIFDTTFEFIGLLAADGTVLEANATALRFGGLDGADVKGRKLWDTYWFGLSEGTQQMLREDVARAARGTFVRREVLVWDADRKPTPIDFSLIPVPDADGATAHLIVEGRDISDLYHARKKLEQTQQMLLHAQRMAGLGSWQWNAGTGRIEWSDEVYRIFDLPAGQDVSFEEYLSRLHPDDRDYLQACVRRALESRQGYTVQHRVVWPDGHTRHVYSVAEVTEDEDGHLVLTGTVHDITSRIEAEQAIRESEARFRLLAENAGDVVCLHAPDGTYLYVSPSAERTMGYRPEELVGTSPYALLHPEDAARVRVDEHQRLLNGEPAKAVLRLRRKDGRYIWVESYSRPHIDPHGDVVRLQSSTRDVTERVEAEQALAQTLQTLEQRNRELQDFAYVASHDLQEPLRKIRAFSDLLRQECAPQLDDTGRHYLSRIEDAAERMVRLISDLLTFSRVATRVLPFQTVNLAEVAEGVLRDLEIAIRDAGATVEVGELPTLDADPMQMRQLLQNLIGNALKFCAPDRPGHVEVRGRVRAAGQSPMVLLEVEDNGIGFDEKYLDRIFAPFQRLHHRTEYAGTGMGLAICRRIVERHGGQITARSTPDQGTTFSVTLPCAQTPPARPLQHHVP